MKIDKSWYIKPKGIPITLVAGGLLVRKFGEKLYIALVKRKGFDNDRLPKGRVEDEENVEKGAAREIYEETGIKDIQLIQKIGVKERLNGQKTRWLIGHYYLFC